MEITHDRSYIGQSSLDFIARGYGSEDLHSLRFQFVYTEGQKCRPSEDNARRKYRAGGSKKKHGHAAHNGGDCRCVCLLPVSINKHAGESSAFPRMFLSK